MSHQYYVYMLASRSRNLYTGVTNNLQSRVAQHREGRIPGFTAKYRINRLVHYEIFGDIRLAIAREKEIKAWRREKRVWLIEKENPFWKDLAAEWFPRGQSRNQETSTPEKPEDKIQDKAKDKADPSPPFPPKKASEGLDSG